MNSNTFNIKVTQKDIDSGIQSDPGCCPVAIALTRTLREHHFSYKNVLITSKKAKVFTDQWETYWNEKFNTNISKNINFLADLPREAMKFIQLFDYHNTSDRKQQLKPFSFEMNLKQQQEEEQQQESLL